MLKEELMQDLKDAMKEKNTIKKDTVQMVRAAILQIEKDKGIEVDDAKIIDDSKPDAQLEEVHQIEKDVMEEMKDIEIKHFGEKKSSVRIDITV